MYGEDLTPTGVYRSGYGGEIMVSFDNGSSEELYDCESSVILSAETARGSGRWQDGSDWFIKIKPEHLTQKYDDPKSGGTEESDGNDEQEQDGDPQDGDPAGDGEQQDGDDSQSSESKDPHGDFEEAAMEDGDDAQEGDGDGQDEEGMREADEMDFAQREGQENEDQPIENPLADDLWPHIKPNVQILSENIARYAADYAVRKVQNGGSGSGGALIKVGKLKPRKIDGVQHHMFPKVLAAVARGTHVYLPGPPGTGKSHMIRQIAEALDVGYHIDSFSPQSTESKLNGYNDANGVYRESGYYRAWCGGWIYGADELDNSNPAIVTGLNSGLANGVHAFPVGTLPAGEGFTVIATANTLGTGPTAEFAGRQKLDPATLNRFVKFFIDTDEAMEDHIVGSMLGDKLAGSWLGKVRQVRRAVADLKIKHFVTMRDSINGAKLIAPGDGAFTQLEALNHTILDVLTDDQVDKIKNWRG